MTDPGSNVFPGVLPAAAVSTVGLFPDPEDTILDLLAGFVAAGNIGRLTPDALSGRMPFIRVTTVGGSDDLVTDRSTVDVDVFESTIGGAGVLGEQVRQFLTVRGGLVTAAGVVVDSVRTVSRPRGFPWPTSGVFRNTASYRFSARRRTT